MGYIDELLEELSARLPELEWKINGLSSSISIHNLPKGIFSSVIEFNGPACIKEIRDDIHALQKHKDESIACFLAERIQKKLMSWSFYAKWTKRIINLNQKFLLI